MFFLKDIKRFLFFSSHQPMQERAGIPARSRPRSRPRKITFNGDVFF